MKSQALLFISFLSRFDTINLRQQISPSVKIFDRNNEVQCCERSLSFHGGSMGRSSSNGCSYFQL